MQPPSDEHTGDATLSIGAVSKATGIPVETLRTWERRYDFPDPERAASGHRRYRPSIIKHLNLINEALDRGHRPANVVGEPIETLRALLDLTDSASLEKDARSSQDAKEPDAQEEDTASEPVQLHSAKKRQSPSAPSFSYEDEDDEETTVSSSTSSAVIEQWMDAMLELDSAKLTESFERTWFKLGALNFLTDLVTPFLEEVGRAWFEGRIAVLHEQFASNHLRRFLSAHWRPLSERARGPKVICAALPGEYHAIGLHMISVVMSLSGCQVVFLGCDTPVKAIAQTASHHDADAVLVSVSAAANAHVAREQLADLRDSIGDVDLLVGGSGAPMELDEGVERLGDLHTLNDWAKRYYLNRTAANA